MVWTHEERLGGCGAKVESRCYCGEKWCRSCFGVWARDAERQIAGVAGCASWPSHLVLTVRDVAAGGLAARVKFLKASFRRLRSRKVWRDNIRGAVACLGLTWAGDWHPHLHVILDCRWVDAAALADAWRAVTGGEGEHISLGRSSAKRGGVQGLAAELVKGTKGDMQGLACAFRAPGGDVLLGEAAAALRGVRWLEFFGAMRETARQVKPATPAGCFCPRCGAPFSWREWSRVVLCPDALAAAWFGPSWADFYRHFVHSPADARAGPQCLGVGA